MTTTNITITNQAPIKPELIPATVAEETGRVALDVFLRYVKDHPIEDGVYLARAAELRRLSRK